MKKHQGPKKLTDTEDESSTDPKAQKHQDTEAQKSTDQKCSKNLQKMKAKCLRVCSLYIVVCVFQYFKWSIAVPFLCVLLCKSISCLCSLGTQRTKEKDPREWKEKGELEDRDNQASHELPILTSSFEEVQVSLERIREELFEQEHCCSVVQQNRQEQCQNGLAGPDQQNYSNQSQAHGQHSQKQEEEPRVKASGIINKLLAPFHKGFKETQSLEFHRQWMKHFIDYQHFEGSRLCAVLGSNDLQGPKSGKEHNRRNKKNIKKCKNRNRRDCSCNVQTHKVPRKKSGKCCRQMCHNTCQCLEHRGSGDSEFQGKQIHKVLQLRDDIEILDFKLFQEQDNVVPKNREEQSPKQTRDREQHFPRADSTKGPGSQVKQSLQGSTGHQHQVTVGPLQLQALGPNVLRNPVKQSLIKPQLEESAYKHQHDTQERDTEKTERLTWKGQYKQNVPKSGRLKQPLSLENSRPPLNNQKRKRQEIWVGSRQGQAWPFEIQCAELICKRGTSKRAMRIVIDLLPTESLPLPDINRRAAWWCPKDEQDVEWRDRMEEKALEEKCLIEILGEKQPCPRELPHSEKEVSNTIQTSEPHHPTEQHETDLVYPQRQQDPEQKVHKNTHAIASEDPKNVLTLEDHCLEDLIKSEEQDSEQLQYIHSYERKLKRRVFLFNNRYRLKHSFEKHANLIRKSGKSMKSIMIVNDLLAIEGLSLLNIKRWREWWCPKNKQGLEHCKQMEGNVFKEQGIIETFGTEKHGRRQHPHLESHGYNNPERPEEQQQVEKKETKLELLQKHHDPEQKVCKDPHVIVSKGPRNLRGLEELKLKVLINSEEQESEQLQCTHSCDQMHENRHRFKGPFEMHYAEVICESSNSETHIQIVDGMLAKKRQPLLHMHKWGAWWCPRDDRGSEQQVYVVGKVYEEQGIPETLGTKEHYLREKPHREWQDFNKPQKPQQQCPVEQIETKLECPQKYQDEQQKLCKDLRVIPFIEMVGTDQHCARVPSHLEWQWSNKLERPEQQHPGEQKENKLEFPQKQQKPEQKRHKDLFSEILEPEKHCPRESSLPDWQYSNKLQIPEWQHLVEQKETEFDFPQKYRDPELRVEKESQFIASDSPECFLDVEEEESQQLQCITTCSHMHKRQHIRVERKHKLKRLVGIHYAGWICKKGKTKKLIKVTNDLLAKDGLPLLHINMWGAWRGPKEDQCSEQQVYRVRKSLEEQGIAKTYGAKKHCPMENPYIECQDFNKPQKAEHQYPVEQNETDLEFPHKHPHPEQKVCKDLHVIPFIEMFCMDKPGHRVPSHLGCQYSNKQHMPEEWYPKEQRKTELEFPQKHNDPEQRVQKHSNAIALDDTKNLLSLEEPSSQHLINSKEQRSGQLQYIPTCDQMLKRRSFCVENRDIFNEPFEMHYPELISKRGKTKNPIKVVNAVLANKGQPLLYIHKRAAWWCPRDDQGSEQQVYVVGKAPEDKGIPETLGTKTHCPMENPYIEYQDFNKPQKAEHQYPVEQNETDLEFPHKHPHPEQKVCKDLHVIPFIEMFCMDKPSHRVPSHLGCQYSNKQHMPEEWYPKEQRKTELEFPQKHNDPEQRVQKHSNAIALDDTKNLLSLEEPSSQHLINSKEQRSGQLQYIPTCDQMLKRRSFCVENRDIFNEPFEMHYPELISKRGKTKNPIKVVNAVLANKGQPLLHIHKRGAWWCPRDDQGSEQQVYVVGKAPEDKGIPETLGTKTHCPMENPYIECQDFNKPQKAEHQYPVEQIETKLECPQKYQDEQQKLCKDLRVIPFIEMFGTDQHCARVPSHLEGQWSNKIERPIQQHPGEQKENKLEFPQKQQKPEQKRHKDLFSEILEPEKHCPRESSLPDWQYSNKLQIPEWQHLVEQKETEFDFPQKYRDPELRVEKESQFIASDSPECFLDVEEEESQQLQCITTCSHMHKRQHIRVECKHRLKRLVGIHYAGWICKKGKTKKLIKVINDLLAKDGLLLLHINRWGAWRGPKEDQCSEQQVYRVRKSLEEQGIAKTYGAKKHCPMENPYMECQDFNKPQKPEHQYSAEQNETDLEFPHKHRNPEQKVCKDLHVTPFIEMFCMDKPGHRVPSHLGCQYSNKQHMPEEWYPREQKKTELEFPQKHNDPEQRVQNVSNAIALNDPENLLSLEEPSSEHLINSKEQRSGQLQYIPTCDQMLKRRSFCVENRDIFNEPFEMHYPELISKRGKTKNPIKVVNAVLANKGQPLLHIHKMGAWWCPRDDQGSEQQVYVVGKAPEDKGIPETLGTKTHCPMENPYIECQDFNKPQKAEHQYPVEQNETDLEFPHKHPHPEQKVCKDLHVIPFIEMFCMDKPGHRVPSHLGCQYSNKQHMPEEWYPREQRKTELEFPQKHNDPEQRVQKHSNAIALDDTKNLLSLEEPSSEHLINSKEQRSGQLQYIPTCDQMLKRRSFCVENRDIFNEPFEMHYPELISKRGKTKNPIKVVNAVLANKGQPLLHIHKRGVSWCPRDDQGSEQQVYVVGKAPEDKGIPETLGTKTHCPMENPYIECQDFNEPQKAEHQYPVEQNETDLDFPHKHPHPEQKVCKDLHVIPFIEMFCMDKPGHRVPSHLGCQYSNKQHMPEEWYPREQRKTELEFPQKHNDPEQRVQNVSNAIALDDPKNLSLEEPSSEHLINSKEKRSGQLQYIPTCDQMLKRGSFCVKNRDRFNEPFEMHYPELIFKKGKTKNPIMVVNAVLANKGQPLLYIHKRGAWWCPRDDQGSEQQVYVVGKAPEVKGFPETLGTKTHCPMEKPHLELLDFNKPQTPEEKYPVEQNESELEFPQNHQDPEQKVCNDLHVIWSIVVPFLCVLLCKSISCVCSLDTQHAKEQNPRKCKEKGLLQDRDNQASHDLPILTSSFEEVQVSLEPVQEQLFEQEHCCSVVQQNRQEQCQNGLAGPDQQNYSNQSQAHDHHSQKQEEEPSIKASGIIKKLHLGELQATFHKGFKETKSLEFHRQWIKHFTDYQHFEGTRLCAELGSNDIHAPRSGREQNSQNKNNLKKCKNRNRRDCSFNVQMHKVPRKKSGKCCRQMCHNTRQCLEYRGCGDSEFQGKQIHKEVQLRDDLEISDFKLLQEQDNTLPKTREEQGPKQTRDTGQHFPRADSTKGPESQVKQSLQGMTGPHHRFMVGPLQLQALGPNVLRNPVKRSFITPQLEESAYKHQHDAQESDTEKTERLTWKGQYKQNVPKPGRLKELLSLENSGPNLNNQKRKRQEIWVESRQGQAWPFEIQYAELICKRGTSKRAMRIVIDLLPTESLPLPDINRQAAWWCPKDEQDVEWRDRMEEKALKEKCLIETLGEKQPCPRELSHSEGEVSNTIQTSEPQNPMEQHGTDLVYPQRQQDPEQKVHKNTHAIASDAPKKVLSLEHHCLEDLIKSDEQDSEQLQYIHSYERKLKRRAYLFKNRHSLKHSFKMHYANLIRKSGKSKKSIMIVNDLLAIEGLSLLNIKRWREWWCPKYKQGLEQCNQMEGNVFKEQWTIETFGTKKHGRRQHPHLELHGYNNPEGPEEQRKVEKKETKLELLQKHHDPEQKVCKDSHVIVSEGPRNLLGLEELKQKVLINSEEQESEQLQCTHSCDQMLENRHRFKGPFEMHYAEVICETSKSETLIQIVDGVLANKRQPLLYMHKWGAWWCPRDDRGSEQQVYVVGNVYEQQGFPETVGTKEHSLREKPHREQQYFNKQQKPQQQFPVEQIETKLECPQKYQDEEQKLCKELRVIPFIEMFGTDQHCARVHSHLEGQCSNKLERPEQQHPGEKKENKLEFPQKQQKPEQKRHKDLLFSEILGTEKHCPRESSLLDWQYSIKLQIPEWQHLVEQKETDLDFPQKHRDPELWVEKDAQLIASDSPECFLDIEEEESEQLQCINTCSQMHKRQHIRVERKHRLKRLVDMHYAGWIWKKGKTKKLIKVINDLLAKDGLPLLHFNRWGAWRHLKEDQCSEQQAYRVRKSPEEQGIAKTYGAKKHCPRENPNIECQNFNKPQKPEHQYTVEQNETDLEFPHKNPNPEQKVCKDLHVIPFIEMFCMDKPCPRVPSHRGCQYSNKQHMPEEWYPREQKKTELEFPQKHNDPEQRIQNVSNAIALDDPKNLLRLEEPKSEHFIYSKEQRSGQLQYKPTCDQMLKRGSFCVENRDRFNEPFEMNNLELTFKRGNTKNPIKVVNGVLANTCQPLLHIHKWGAWWCPRDDQGSEKQVYVVGKAPEDKGIPETLGTKTHSAMDKPLLELPDFNELQTPEEQYPVEQNESELEFPQNHQDPEQKVFNDLHVVPFIEMLDTDKHYPRVPSHLKWQYSNKHQMPEQQNRGEKKELGLVFPQKHQDPKLMAQRDPHGILCSDLWGMENHSSREHPLLEWQYSNKLQMLEQQHLVQQKQTELEFPEKHQHREQRVHKDSPIKALDDPKHLPALEEPGSEDLLNSEEQGSEQLQHIPTCDRMLKNSYRFKGLLEFHHAELICNTGKTKKSIEAVKCMLEKESLNLFHIHRCGACWCPRDDQGSEEEVYMVGNALEEQGIPETLNRQYHCAREKPHLE
ncbi:uncharacterized protein [Ambystoma mexicanum]|uniref:uncharacterized protein n=1 Tax=Ambystoma mexicanum TaxID=8296 RepID=UPI0037E84599